MSALGGVERSTSRPGRFTPRGESTSVEWGTGWVPAALWQLWRREKLEISIVSNKNVIAFYLKWRMQCLAIGDEWVCSS
jgi:hypothetical protein